MPTQEPNHYWPFDQFPPEPASEETEPPLANGNTVMPFLMTSGDAKGRDLLFETKFFSVAPEPDPKDRTPNRGATTSPKVTNLSLGEDLI